MHSFFKHTFLWILVLFPLIALSFPKSGKLVQDNFDVKIEQLSLKLSIEPQNVIEEIRSMRPFCTDSICYYRLLTLEAQAMLHIPKLDSMKSMLESSIEYCGKHEMEAVTSGLYSSSYNALGGYYLRKASLDTARILYKKAFQTLFRSNQCIMLPDVAVNIAGSYVRSGCYDLGAYWYWKSISLSDSLDIPEEKRLSSYLGLAKVYMELQNFSASDSCNVAAERYFDRMTPLQQHAYLNNYGISYSYRKDYQTALYYFKRALELVDEWPHMKYACCITETNLGEMYLMLDELDSASTYLKKGAIYFQSINDSYVLSFIHAQMIELAVRQKNMALAEKRIEEAAGFDYEEPGMRHLLNQYMQHYFEEVGDFKNAYYYQKENKNIDDSLRNGRILMRCSEVALRYQLDKELMQKEILIRQQENKMLRLHQWLYLISSVTLVMVVLIWAFFLYRRGMHEKKILSMQSAINSLRLDNVRNRISPHFILNVLNHEVDRRKDTTDKNCLLTLSHLLRRQLELADQISITLSDELDFVRCFLDLEKQSLGKDFVFQIDMDKSVNLDKIFIPSMSIYILVENAVKHSLAMKTDNRKLWLRILDKGNRIEIKLCDNGGGFKAVKSTMGTGTGFKIITRTIQLYNQYNEELIYMDIHNVEIGDSEIGCEVSYSIPKNYKFIIKS